MLGILKRSQDGTHHAFHCFKDAGRYLGESPAPPLASFHRHFYIEAVIPCLLVVAARCKPRSERAP